MKLNFSISEAKFLNLPYICRYRDGAAVLLGAPSLPRLRLHLLEAARGRGGAAGQGGRGVREAGGRDQPRPEDGGVGRQASAASTTAEWQVQAGPVRPQRPGLRWRVLLQRVEQDGARVAAWHVTRAWRGHVAAERCVTDVMLISERRKRLSVQLFSHRSVIVTPAAAAAEPRTPV